MKIATIDVGTNTTLLLVAEATSISDVRVLKDRAEVTRLGRGIGTDGRLGAEGVARTLKVLAEYADDARVLGAQVKAIGTEALRRAPNADEFLVPATKILGGPLEVIGGVREAALTFLAAVTSFPELSARPIVVIDIGGGSTEVIVSQGGLVQSRVSLPVGAVRLTERFVKHDPPMAAEAADIDAEMRTLLQDIPRRAPGDERYELIGTAGTVTTLAAMALGLRTYDPDVVHGHHLDRSTLAAQMARLQAATQAERETFDGLDPRRADVIFAGARILNAFVEHLDADHVVVNDRGIRWGLFYETLAQSQPA
ncbi:MAG TPA: Ppx/GppA phosphatase family protein [Polyangia bacterium]